MTPSLYYADSPILEILLMINRGRIHSSFTLEDITHVKFINIILHCALNTDSLHNHPDNLY